MKLQKFLIAFVFFCLLSACSHVSPKQEFIRQVDTQAYAPQAVFLLKDTLYIEYEHQGEKIYLAGDLKEAFAEGKEQVVELEVKRDLFAFSAPQPVYIVNDTAEEILRKTLVPLTPANPHEGILLFIQAYEMVLVRQEDGTPDLMPLSEVTADIQIVGKIDAAEISQHIKKQLLKELKTENPAAQRFLLRFNSLPLTPFVYVDLQNNQFYQLQLPDYYKARMEMSSLGYSATFIYSFVVKSHLWSVLKAPFTTTHRLGAYATSTVYTLLPPHIWDLNTVPPLNEGDERMNLVAFNNWLDKHINKQRYKARVELLVDGEEYFPHLLLAAQRAQEHIFVRLYIFRADPYGMTVADVLKKRALEDVDVRVLLDELNVVLASDKQPELKTDESFVQPRTIKKYLKQKSPVKVRTHLNPWGTFDHGKVILIDHRLAYTGGMNIGQEYRYTWHDMMIALEGPVVDKLVKNFYKDWSFAGWGGDYAAAYRQLFSKRHRAQNEATPDMVDVRLLYTKPNDSEIFDTEREAMRRAQKRIYMENPYFSDDRIIKELIDARGRGVDVRVVFPDKNNVGVMDKNNRYIANKLIKNGVRVYFYKGMTHVKAALFDNYAVVGSANVDKMSLYINREMSVGISDATFVKELEMRLFEKDFSNSEELLEPLQIGWLYGVVSSLANQL